MDEAACGFVGGAFPGGGASQPSPERYLFGVRRFWARAPVIYPPRRGGMEGFGRSQRGSIKRATTPPAAGVMTLRELAFWLRQVGQLVSARQRMWPSRRP